ncbi:HD domain-containing protein [Nocardioides pacificus]
MSIDGERLHETWPLPAAGPLRDALLASYSDPARGYHDLRHLTEVLDRVEELAEAGELFDLPVVLLAAWFHDAVYDARPGPEERSARWATESLSALGLPADLVDEVARLVRVTERHRPEPNDAAACALTDADLAILAAPAERYAEYAADVRREYAAVPDDDFRAGRAAVLADLLAKPTLFHTAYARERWEQPARDNVSREISRLTRHA